MDLSLVERRIDAQRYASAEALHGDVAQVWANVDAYWDPARVLAAGDTGRWVRDVRDRIAAAWRAVLSGALGRQYCAADGALLRRERHSGRGPEHQRRVAAPQQRAALAAERAEGRIAMPRRRQELLAAWLAPAAIRADPA
eukprot:gene49831-23232_t